MPPKSKSNASSFQVKKSETSNDTTKKYVPAFNLKNAFYERTGGIPEGLVVYDRAPGTSGYKPLDTLPEFNFKWIKTLLVEAGKPQIKGIPKIISVNFHPEILTKIDRFKEIADPAWRAYEFIKHVQESFERILSSDSISPSMVLANAHPDPNNKRYGLDAYFTPAAKQADILDFYSGRMQELQPTTIIENGILADKNKHLINLSEREYGLSAITHWITATKEGSVYRYFSDLPKQEEIANMLFYPPELGDQVQTENVFHAAALLEHDYRLPFACVFAHPIPNGRIGYSYGEAYWFMRDDCHREIFDQKNRVIPTVFYCGDLVSLDTTLTNFVNGTSKPNRIYVDRVSLIQLVKQGVGLSFSAGNTEVTASMQQVRTRLEQLGYIPKKPEGLSNNLELEFFKAATKGDLDTLVYLLEWANPKLKNINCILENSELNPDGGTALHLAAVNGHPYVAQYLLNMGADHAIKNKKGITALGLAQKQEEKSEDQEISTCLRNHEIRVYYSAMLIPRKSPVDKPTLDISRINGITTLRLLQGGKTANSTPPRLYANPVKIEVAKKAGIEDTLNKFTETLGFKSPKWACKDDLSIVKLKVDSEADQKMVVAQLKERCPEINAKPTLSTVGDKKILTVTVFKPDFFILKKLLSTKNLESKEDSQKHTAVGNAAQIRGPGFATPSTTRTSVTSDSSAVFTALPAPLSTLVTIEAKKDGIEEMLNQFTLTLGLQSQKWLCAEDLSKVSLKVDSEEDQQKVIAQLKAKCPGIQVIAATTVESLIVRIKTPDFFMLKTFLPTEKLEANDDSQGQTTRGMAAQIRGPGFANPSITRTSVASNSSGASVSSATTSTSSTSTSPSASNSSATSVTSSFKKLAL